MSEYLTVRIAYDASETTANYLMYQIGAIDGVTDLTAHVPYNVVSTDTDEPVAVLPNRQAAEDTMRNLAGDYYVTPVFNEEAVQYEPESPQGARVFYVCDNTTRARVSTGFDTEEKAGRLCREMNTPSTGGRYGVYDQNGVRYP